MAHAARVDDAADDADDNLHFGNAAQKNLEAARPADELAGSDGHQGRVRVDGPVREEEQRATRLQMADGLAQRDHAPVATRTRNRMQLAAPCDTKTIYLSFINRRRRGNKTQP